MRPTHTLGRWCTTAVVVLTSSLLASAEEGVFRITDQPEQPAAVPSIDQPTSGAIVRGQDAGSNPFQLIGRSRTIRTDRGACAAGCGENCQGHACNCNGCNCNGGNCQGGNCQGGHGNNGYCQGGYCEGAACGHGNNGCGQLVLDHLFGWLIPSGCVAPVGKYRTVYADNPTYADPRDSSGQVYGVQGYGISMAVPLAPTVRQSYNYSWGIPSSRITPIGHKTVGAVGSQPLRHRTW